MIKTTFFILLAAFVMLSCDRNPDLKPEPEDMIDVLAFAYYEKGGKQSADKGAHLFIFENFDNYKEYSFDPETKCYIHKQNGEIKECTSLVTANEKGCMKAYTSYGQNCVIVIQSHAYPNQFRENFFLVEQGFSLLGVGNIVFKEE